MPNLVNRLVSQELASEFKDSDGMLVISFAGLTVKESETLRTQMAAKGVKLRMVRNSLARRVLAERGLELSADALAGNTAIAYGKAEAAIYAAKLLTAPEVKKVGKVKVRAGMLDGLLLGAADALSLADVPDRNTLNAKLLGCISGPARGLVGVINGTPSGLVRLLQAHADQLQAAGGGAPEAPVEAVAAPAGADDAPAATGA